MTSIVAKWQSLSKKDKKAGEEKTVQADDSTRLTDEKSDSAGKQDGTYSTHRVGQHPYGSHCTFSCEYNISNKYTNSVNSLKINTI